MVGRLSRRPGVEVDVDDGVDGALPELGAAVLAVSPLLLSALLGSASAVFFLSSSSVLVSLSMRSFSVRGFLAVWLP